MSKVAQVFEHSDRMEAFPDAMYVGKTEFTKFHWEYLKINLKGPPESLLTHIGILNSYDSNVESWNTDISV